MSSSVCCTPGCDNELKFEQLLLSQCDECEARRSEEREVIQRDRLAATGDDGIKR